jgi:hypothetical protein
MVRFFRLFFSGFLGLIGFLVFLLTLRFSGLIQLTRVFFFVFFNWYFFFLFHPLAFGKLWIRFHNLFWFIFYKVISILWLGSCILRINSGRLKSFYCVLFLNWLFFHFQPLTISLLKFEFHNLFWYDFYKVITTSWSWLRVWQINSSWLGLFFCLFSMRLSRSHDPVHGFVRLT